MTEYGTVDLAVQDTDLAEVLQMLSIQSRKNIITSKSVSATVTANLFDVTFYEALDSILRVNGYGYIEEGNFIYVYTQEELAEIEAAQRRRVSRSFDLEYLSAADAAAMIQPLLSEDGKAAALGDVGAGFRPTTEDGGADEYAYNARVVVNDYPDVIEKVAALLGDLDTPPKQVMVEATILQTALDEDNAFGVDFSVIGSIDFTNLTSPLGAVNNLLSPDDEDGGFRPDDDEATAITSTVGNTTGAGGFKIGIIDDDVSVFVRALDEVTDTVVLARPKVMALNRQRAEVLVGRRVGYLSTTATETTSTQTIEYLDTGINLIFRPFISNDGMIRLELAPSVSEARFRDTTDAQGTIVTIPDEITNELTTNVRVRDGETLVLGGLFRESTSVTRRQVPFLGDVPLLGAAFRGQDDSVTRSEIIFLITPTVVHDEALWDIGQEALARATAIQVGARDLLLPFSREKMTDSYNTDALQAFSRGDVEMALYYANTSLRLNPNQPEMIRFRERVSAEKHYTYERNVLERILRRELDDAETGLRQVSQIGDGQAWDVPGSTPAVAGGPAPDTNAPGGSEDAPQPPSTQLPVAVSPANDDDLADAPEDAQSDADAADDDHVVAADPQASAMAPESAAVSPAPSAFSGVNALVDALAKLKLDAPQHAAHRDAAPFDADADANVNARAAAEASLMTVTDSEAVADAAPAESSDMNAVTAQLFLDNWVARLFASLQPLETAAADEAECEAPATAPETHIATGAEDAIED